MIPLTITGKLVDCSAKHSEFCRACRLCRTDFTATIEAPECKCRELAIHPYPWEFCSICGGYISKPEPKPQKCEVPNYQHKDFIVGFKKPEPILPKRLLPIEGELCCKEKVAINQLIAYLEWKEKIKC